MSKSYGCGLPFLMPSWSTYTITSLRILTTGKTPELAPLNFLIGEPVALIFAKVYTKTSCKLGYLSQPFARCQRYHKGHHLLLKQNKKKVDYVVFLHSSSVGVAREISDGLT
jgi:hypothetical protein